MEQKFVTMVLENSTLINTGPIKDIAKDVDGQALVITMSNGTIERYEKVKFFQIIGEKQYSDILRSMEDSENSPL